MTSTAVRVGLRVRPLTEKEILNNCTECLSCITDAPQILLGADKSFTYDYVFHSNTEQSQVYQQAASPLLHKFIDGFNATILAYGQTGSGKTYSMGTTLTNSGNEGIVPRCITELFEILRNREGQDSDFKYEIYVSFLELYNEEFIDLLTPQSKRKSQPEVSIREDIAGQIYWSGVKEKLCDSPQDVLDFLAQGSLNRTTGSTEMNSVSSRSHAIFSILLKQQKPQAEEEEGRFLSSKFHFVDLAGSERLKRTHAQGDRAREGIAINSGLLALGNVISALGDETRKATHIPYRDSKLTRLLQDSLGGNSQTLMLACVSPADTNFQETLSTLKYANRARNIKNKVSVNQEFSGSVEVSQLKTLVSKLRLEIAQLRTNPTTNSMTAHISQLTAERDTLLMKQGGELETHPVIERYLETINQLQGELQTTRSQLKAMQERTVLQKFTQPTHKKPHASTSSSSSRYRVGLNKMRRPTKSTSTSLRKKKRAIKAKRLDDLQEGDIVRHDEVKESIAKVRADIRKSLQVLELVKPPEDTNWEDELKAFEEEEKNQHGQEDDRCTLNIDQFIKDIESMTTPERSGDENSRDTKYSSQLSRMLHQIQSDIKIKEELVSHLEKSETEYTFMRKKFDEMISELRVQLTDTQREMARTRPNSKTENRQSIEPPRRQEYENKIKQLNAKILDLSRKYANATATVQSARNQNECALKSLKSNIQRLETEKRRLAQRMRVEAERVREQILKQERKIQQLQRQQAQSNQAKKRLEREHEEQKTVLKKRDEEILVSSNQLKEMISVMKRAVREGGILDERMLSKITPILGGHFAVIARGGGHGFPKKKKKKNPIPLGVRVTRKKQLLDKALSQYIQGKQALVEMENLLVRRERLVKEKRELEEEREYVMEDGQTADMIAIELMDERIELVSAEISYLSARVHCLQKEAAEESLQAEDQMTVFNRPAKHVTFVDEIVSEINQEEQWMDIDTFDEQFSVPVNAAPEVAYETTCKLIKSFEADECQTLIENLVDDIMELKMNDNERQTMFKNMEQTIHELTQALNNMKEDKEQDMLGLIMKRDSVGSVNNTRLVSLPNSPVASPPYNANLQPPEKRESITPSPDRFFNMFQGRLSWQQQEAEPLEQYLSDHDSSTSSIRSSHLRRSSIQSNSSIPSPPPQQEQHPSPMPRLIKRPSIIDKASSSVFDRLAQTPTRSSRAKMNHRHSSSSVEDLNAKWEPFLAEDRPHSANTSRMI